MNLLEVLRGLPSFIGTLPPSIRKELAGKLRQALDDDTLAFLRDVVGTESSSEPRKVKVTIISDETK